MKHFLLLCCFVTLHQISYAQCPSAHAGSDTTICSSDDIPLNAIEPGAGKTGAWSGGLGTYTPDNTTRNATYTPTEAELLAGSLTFVWTVDSATCSTNDEVIFSFDQVQDDPLAGPDDTITCTQGNYVLNGNMISNGFAEWSVTAGTGGLNEVELPNPMVSGASAGVNTFCYTNQSMRLKCPAKTDCMNLVNLATETPSVTIALSTPTPLCSEPFNAVVIDSTGGGDDPTFCWSTPFTLALKTPIGTDETERAYTLTRSTNISTMMITENCGFVNSNEIFVDPDHNPALPDPIITISPDKYALCGSESVTIRAISNKPISFYDWSIDGVHVAIFGDSITLHSPILNFHPTVQAFGYYEENCHKFIPSNLLINLTIGHDTSCGTISGNVFVDDNKNCINDGNDINLEGTIVSLNNGSHFAVTDADGNYTFRLPHGTYEIHPQFRVYDSLSCSSNTVTIDENNTTHTGKNFGAERHLVGDLSVDVFCGRARPGRQQFAHVYLRNVGNTNISVPEAVLVFDDRITYHSEYRNYKATTTGISNDSIYISSNTLAPGEQAHIMYLFDIPIDLNLVGDTLVHAIYNTSNFNDANPNNDQRTCSTIITNSYDPNDKTVFPAGEGEEGAIVQEDVEWLDYRIRFQNTGTDTAFTVIVTDTISPYIDLSTLEVIGATHGYEFEIVNTFDNVPKNILVWTFPNILLPDSNVDERGSHGAIYYKVKLKPNLDIGTEVLNTANIFFDYNPAVITNTAKNTISNVATSIAAKTDHIPVHIFPNPGTDIVHIMSEENLMGSHLTLTNQMGQLLQSRPITSSSELLDISALPRGVYFINIVSGQLNVSKKLVKN